MSRPIKYHERYCEIARKLSEKGFMLKDVAEVLDCHESTLKRWQEKYPDFADAIAAGLDALDVDAVERAHFKRAIGYEIDCEEIETVETPDGQITEKKVKRSKQHVPGNVTAQKNILFNLKRSKYAQKIAEDNNIVPDINFIFRTDEKDNKSSKKSEQT